MTLDTRKLLASSASRRARTSLLFALAAHGCGGGDGVGQGDARILVEAEATITDGLSPGADEESIADGWAVTYATFDVAIGDVALGRSADASASATAGARVILDLTTVDTGYDLVTLMGVDAGRWDLFSFETPAASDATPCDASVTADDCARMQGEGLTYLLRGTLTKTGGESCPPPEGACRPAEAIDFELAVAAPTRFSHCEGEEAGGIAVPGGGETTASLTLHGDHLFFNGFPGGVEDLVTRRAQWLANADVDGDDFVDMAELGGIPATDFPGLFTAGTEITDFAAAYSLTGSPISPLTSAADYVRAQLSTQGHLNGEGECAFDVL
jgi:hypothetical protein